MQATPIFDASVVFMSQAKRYSLLRRFFALRAASLTLIIRLHNDRRFNWAGRGNVMKKHCNTRLAVCPREIPDGIAGEKFAADFANGD
jgi:hypothetical protein